MHPYQHAAAHPDRPALILAETGETLTYRELDRASNRGAHLFRSLGLATGDTLAIAMANEAWVVEAVWAAQRAGLYYVGISTKLTADEMGYILRDAGATLLIHAANCGAGALAADQAGIMRLEAGAGADPRHSFDRARAAFADTLIADEAPGQDMLYSSGTTGRHKGIRFPPLEGGIEEEGGVATIARSLYGFGEDTVFLSPAPLYHAAPLRFVCTIHRVGGTAVIMRRFDAEGVLAAIARYRVTHAQFVPTHFVRMLKLPDAVRLSYPHHSLRAAIHAAAPCPQEVKRAMIDWWGPIVHEYYASTETIGFTAVTSAEWLDRPGTVGRAVIGTIHVCGEEGEPLPVGEEGTIHFSGGIPLSYHNDPAKTAEAHNRHGWATVGDVGRVDEAGYLYLTDRRSFMIISGGVNIYPQEIENALIEHPEVADAAVIGVPDAEMGESVLAVVQPVDMGGADDALAAALQAYLRGRISAVKLPRRIEWRAVLPREPTGKLMKRHLRDEYRVGA